MSRLVGHLALLTVALFALPSCCYLRGYRTPTGLVVFRDTSRPTLALREKAELYQRRLERHHQSPEGLLQYAIDYRRPTFGSYGDLADGPFHTGIYLSSQAHRYAATDGSTDAREQVLLALRGLRTLMEVTGVRGLLARYFSRTADIPLREGSTSGELEMPDDWQRSTPRPEFCWRTDVSKDQYSGFIHGLGVTLALVDDPEIRAEVTELATAAADHLIENDLRIIDADGEPTKHSDLRGSVAFVPIGVHALIVLAIAKTAAVGSRDSRYTEFYRSLIEDGYASKARWAHVSVFGVGNRVNDNMAHLALYPLLLLEDDEAILDELWRGEQRSWRAVREDRNAFFAFVYATAASRTDENESSASAVDRGHDALEEFPEDKIAWPVDLTRAGFDFPRRFLNTWRCRPATTHGVPLYLRAVSSNLWVSDPHRLVSNLSSRGDEEFSGADYLQAYWIGRHHGFVAAGD